MLLNVCVLVSRCSGFGVCCLLLVLCVVCCPLFVVFDCWSMDVACVLLFVVFRSLFGVC